MFRKIISGMTLALVSGTLCAQSYPSKPIRYIIPFAPGGGQDLVGRALAPRLTEGLGQQVLIDNRPGANGMM